MGRRKIEFKPITDKRSRKDIFYKRKTGLVKKAAELSMLCNVRMLVVFEDLSGEIVKYSTHGIYDPVEYFTEKYLNSKFEFTSVHYPDFFRGSAANKKNNEEEEVPFEENDNSEDDDEQQFDIEPSNTMKVSQQSAQTPSNSDFKSQMPSIEQTTGLTSNANFGLSNQNKEGNYTFNQNEQNMGYQNSAINNIQHNQQFQPMPFTNIQQQMQPPIQQNFNPNLQQFIHQQQQQQQQHQLFKAQQQFIPQQQFNTQQMLSPQRQLSPQLQFNIQQQFNSQQQFIPQSQFYMQQQQQPSNFQHQQSQFQQHNLNLPTNQPLYFNNSPQEITQQGINPNYQMRMVDPSPRKMTIENAEEGPQGGTSNVFFCR